MKGYWSGKNLSKAHKKGIGIANRGNSRCGRPGHSLTKKQREHLSRLNTGKHLSKETKNKLRKANLGKKYGIETCQKKKSISLISTWKKLHTKFPNKWKKTLRNHGIRLTYEYRVWRTSVLKRDGYICKRCNSKNKLQAHHKLPFSRFPELRFAVSNGETLCEKCHKKIRAKTI